MTYRAELLAFWGKWGSHETTDYHPLLWHMIDVGLVAQLLWTQSLAPAQKAHMAKALGLSVAAAGAWLPFFVALHDLGKASPVFQAQVMNPAREALLASLALVASPGLPSRKHGAITAARLPGHLKSEWAVPLALAKQLGVAVGGHHGLFPPPQGNNSDDGTGLWESCRGDLVRVLAQVFGVVGPWPGQAEATSDALVALAGFTTVADWVGSNQDFFGGGTDAAHGVPQLALDAYVVRSRNAARDALTRLGWMVHPQVDAAPDFEALFGFAPNALQQAAQQAAQDLDGPGLVVLEAAMGQGKTEAALAIVDRLQASGFRGAYLALPTQATSNQLFTRMSNYLRGRYPGEAAQLLLLHGHADLNAEFEWLQKQGLDELPLSPWGIEEDAEAGESEARLVAMAWFSNKKRGLLSPFGVGTIDQSLLGALRVKHLFVRLFGLAGKVVVFDEVHAYDLYMGQLLERLLAWLGAMGTPVVLLSATLPGETRKKLLSAYTGRRELAMPHPEASYPRVTWVQGPVVHSVALPVEPNAMREVALRWLDTPWPDAENPAPEFAAQLLAQLQEGGCALILCNTVSKAQATFGALAQAWSGQDIQVELFHARFPFGARSSRETRALKLFGKPSATAERPERCVLVATQVVEQSLDLDFDLILTEMAPVDLLLQRMGRLHRHQRGRPMPLRQPTLWVSKPSLDDEGKPQFGAGTEAVYEPFLLLRSWLALKNRTTIQVPSDLEPMVEEVYAPTNEAPEGLAEPLKRFWAECLDAFEKAQCKFKEEANKRIIPLPQGPDDESDINLSRLTEMAREEDRPELHRALRAETRLASESVVLVCASEGPDGRLRLHDGLPIDLTRVPDRTQTRRLLEASVSLSSKSVVFKLRALEGELHRPAAWQRHPLLKDLRLIPFDGEACFRGVPGWVLRNDPKLGLVQQKETA